MKGKGALAVLLLNFIFAVYAGVLEDVPKDKIVQPPQPPPGEKQFRANKLNLLWEKAQKVSDNREEDSRPLRTAWRERCNNGIRKVDARNGHFVIYVKNW